MIAVYVDEKQESIDKAANTSGILLPGEAFWTYIDAKVESTYSAAYLAESSGISQDFVPESYIHSNYQYHTRIDDNGNAISDEAQSSLVNDYTMKAIIRYGGYNSSKVETLWANFDTWTAEANKDNTLKECTPTASYISNYKSTINGGVGGILTCITPDAGYYGIGENEYVAGKTWSQAFNNGPIEGLFVYPVALLLHIFTTAYGVNGGGQILAIFLVTLIVRFIIVVFSFRSTLSQSKMSMIQPQLALLQSKYPNASSNNYEKQKLAQDQMALYKKNGIHPFRQIALLLVQFPVFIAVWGALQGSAILTKGQVFGLSLSTVTYKAILGMNGETIFAIILFLLMSIAQFFATEIPLWIQNYRKEKAVGAKTVKVTDESTTGQMMKWMPLIMMVVIIFMGLTLPAAMGIYWFFGAIISIIQSILIEIYQSVKKSKKPKVPKSGRSDSHNKKYMKLN
jgi:YidC/Oxa1 family membrane protein insertase